MGREIKMKNVESLIIALKRGDASNLFDAFWWEDPASISVIMLALIYAKYRIYYK